MNDGAREESQAAKGKVKNCILCVAASTRKLRTHSPPCIEKCNSFGNN